MEFRIKTDIGEILVIMDEDTGDLLAEIEGDLKRVLHENDRKILRLTERLKLNPNDLSEERDRLKFIELQQSNELYECQQKVPYNSKKRLTPEEKESQKRERLARYLQNPNFPGSQKVIRLINKYGWWNAGDPIDNAFLEMLGFSPAERDILVKELGTAFTYQQIILFAKDKIADYLQ